MALKRGILVDYDFGPDSHATGAQYRSFIPERMSQPAPKLAFGCWTRTSARRSRRRRDHSTRPVIPVQPSAWGLFRKSSRKLNRSVVPVRHFPFKALAPLGSQPHNIGKITCLDEKSRSRQILESTRGSGYHRSNRREVLICLNGV